MQRNRTAILLGALAVIVTGGGSLLSADTQPMAEYNIECWYNPPVGAGVIYGTPCDPYGASLACQEASTYCGLSLTVSMHGGNGNECWATCAEES